jgi:FG-GAP repeat
MKRIYFFYLLLVLISSSAVRAQIGLGGQPHQAAVLDLQSPGNDKVFMPPRLTSAQRKAIANPPAGSLVFDTDKYFMYLFDGQNWLPLSTGDPNILSPNASRTLADGTYSDFFGCSVAISGNYALVGAQGKNNFQGAVYVFSRTGNTWTQQGQITPAGTTNQFGKSVAISGDYAIVGATAAAYIFMRNGTVWTQQQQIGYSNNPFGIFSPSVNVAISGDNAVVGAPESDYATSTSIGKVYFYQRDGTTWPLRNMVTSSTTGSLFGRSVSMSGGYAVIGAPGVSPRGAVYIYWLRNVFGTFQWVQQAQLLPATGSSANYNFGSSVSLSGDYAVVGAKGDNTLSQSGGSVTVFMRNGTAWTGQLIDESNTTGEQLGYSVAISGDYIIAGIPYLSSSAGAGAAYLYKRSATTWSRTRIISEINLQTPHNGTAVSIDNGMVLIGGKEYLNIKGKIIFDVVD